MAAVNGRSRRRPGGGGRRAFFLAAVGLVVLALGFGLGVVVGQKWARPPPLQAGPEPPKKAPARRALSDAEGVKPPQVQEKLTFYQTLTAPLAATPPAPKAEAPKPEVKPRGEVSQESPAAPDVPPLTEAAREAPLSAERAWTVQVSAYRARPAAEELERQLKEAGFEAYVAAITGADGRTTYRVRVGSFSTRGEAQRMAERLRSERGLEPFVSSR